MIEIINEYGGGVINPAITPHNKATSIITIHFIIFSCIYERASILTTCCLFKNSCKIIVKLSFSLY